MALLRLYAEKCKQKCSNTKPFSPHSILEKAGMLIVRRSPNNVYHGRHTTRTPNVIYIILRPPYNRPYNVNAREKQRHRDTATPYPEYENIKKGGFTALSV